MIPLVVRAFVVVAAGMIALSTPAAHASTPLANPSAEDSADALPGWQGVGFRPAAYGAGPEVPAAPEYPAHGSRLFQAVQEGAVLEQTVGLDDAAAEIDAGRQSLWIAGRFGGPTASDATAALEIGFRDAAGAELGSSGVGGPNNAQRGGQTRLMTCYRRVPVPPGARSVAVRLVGRGGPGGLADVLDVTTAASVPDARPGTYDSSTGCFEPGSSAPPPPPPPPAPDRGSPPPPPLSRVAPAPVSRFVAVPRWSRCIRSTTFRVRLLRAARDDVQWVRLRVREAVTTLRVAGRTSTRLRSPRSGRPLRIALTVRLRDGRTLQAQRRVRACRAPRR